jgi:GWxTD domain-containing protein
MLPEEQRAFRRLRNNAEADVFIAAFWRRRDPDPETPENPFLDQFWERVQAADRLYAEGRRRGSLSDRGRALVLLGPPTTVRIGQQSAPRWNPRRPARDPGFSVRPVNLETWEYAAAELPPQLAVLVADAGMAPPALSFIVETDRARLVDGERYLELAARAAVGSAG